jgi:hypothetical protein
MNKSFIIYTEKDRGLAVSYLNNVSLATPLRMEVKPFKKDRTAAQNRLMWEWLTVIGNDLGYTKDEMYEEMSDLYLPMIEMRRLNGEKREVRLTTSKLNTNEFTDFLNNIDLFAAGMGIRLPHPEDLMWEAMGIKKG